MDQQQQRLAAGVAGVVLLAVVAYVVWPIPSEAPSNAQFSGNTKTSESAPNTPAKSGTGSAPKGGGGTSVSPGSGSYETYTPEKVTYAKTGKVVLFFNSPSCEGCKLLDTDIRAHLRDFPRDVKILKVDFDSDTATKAKYGVMSPNLFIQVDASGGKITQWSGSLTLQDILTRVVRF